MRFLLMTVIVILLILYSQYSINNSLNDLKNDEQLMEAASRQQRMTLQITQIMTADQLQGITMTLPLDSLTGKLEYMQNHVLLEGASRIKYYAHPDTALVSTFVSFNNALNELLNQDGITTYVKLLNTEKNYLESLDRYMVAVSEHSNAKMNRFRRLQVLIMWGTIVLITLGAIFNFLPAVKKIKLQNDRLKQIAFNQSHVVRRPLANIKLFLNLMPISTVEEKSELLTHIQTEAEELDDIICNSVNEAALII